MAWQPSDVIANNFGGCGCRPCDGPAVLDGTAKLEYRNSTLMRGLKTLPVRFGETIQYARAI
jgi:hypothetical protein